MSSKRTSEVNDSNMFYLKCRNFSQESTYIPYITENENSKRTEKMGLSLISGHVWTYHWHGSQFVHVECLNGFIELMYGRMKYNIFLGHTYILCINSLCSNLVNFLFKTFVLLVLIILEFSIGWVFLATVSTINLNVSF